MPQVLAPRCAIGREPEAGMLSVGPRPPLPSWTLVQCSTPEVWGRPAPRARALGARLATFVEPDGRVHLLSRRRRGQRLCVVAVLVRRAHHAPGE